MGKWWGVLDSCGPHFGYGSWESAYRSEVVWRLGQAGIFLCSEELDIDEYFIFIGSFWLSISGILGLMYTVKSPNLAA